MYLEFSVIFRTNAINDQRLILKIEHNNTNSSCHLQSILVHFCLGIRVKFQATIAGLNKYPIDTDVSISLVSSSSFHSSGFTS